jgi:predicted membrane protein
MENEMNNMNDNFWQEAEKRHKRGKILGGFLIVLVGCLFLSRELGMEIPQWVFTWKTLLIALGLMIGVKSSFRSPKWIILVIIGTVFLISDNYPELAIRHFLWPSLLILFGLMVIFKPHRGFRNHPLRNRRYQRYARYSQYQQCNDTGYTQNVNDDKIDSTTFMGSVKKNILSKNFKGGDITNVLGGAEINLSQADFEGTIVLEITNVLGGTKLIVPANWEIQSELVSVLGSIEDKRPVQTGVPNEKNKVLVLKGTVFMGGIDIRSY